MLIYYYDCFGIYGDFIRIQPKLRAKTDTASELSGNWIDSSHPFLELTLLMAKEDNEHGFTICNNSGTRKRTCSLEIMSDGASLVVCLWTYNKLCKGEIS